MTTLTATMDRYYHSLNEINNRYASPPSDDHYLSLVQDKEQEHQQKMKGLLRSRFLWTLLTGLLLLLFAISALAGKLLDSHHSYRNTESAVVRVLVATALFGLVSSFACYCRLYAVQHKLDTFNRKLVVAEPVLNAPTKPSLNMGDFVLV